jgi:hypothetical protein
MSRPEHILVSAPTKAGEQFIQLLKLKEVPFAVITNSKAEKKRLERTGVEKLLFIQTREPETWVKPDYPVGRVFLFQRSLPLCCCYLQMTRSWTGQAVYVITDRNQPQGIYKALGADEVIYSRTGNLGYLIRTQPQ